MRLKVYLPRRQLTATSADPTVSFIVKPPETIRTDRLVLQKPAPRDAPEIFRSYAGDPVVTKYLSWYPHRTVVDTTDFLVLADHAWDRGDGYAWVIRLREERRVIGMIEGRIQGPRMELGYVLAHAWWGKGYATEAVKAVSAWALGQDSIHRVWAVCDVENDASARVLEKAGMEREGVLRRWIMLPNRSGLPRDVYCYAIVKP